MKTEFTTADFNPDGMTEGELVDWIYFLRNRTDATEILFGHDTEEDAQQVELACRYCEEKLRAFRNRLAGNIQTAIAQEHNCELIYADIKEPLRW